MDYELNRLCNRLKGDHADALWLHFDLLRKTGTAFVPNNLEGAKDAKAAQAAATAAARNPRNIGPPNTPAGANKQKVTGTFLIIDIAQGC